MTFDTINEMRQQISKQGVQCELRTPFVHIRVQDNTIVSLLALLLGQMKKRTAFPYLYKCDLVYHS